MNLKPFINCIFFLFPFCSLANDGAFFAMGNQLIPITENDISVKKEILSIKKVEHDYIEVNVYYEFFNPYEAKEIIVGFEAFAPYGDVEGAANNGNHPYINDFTVDMNGSLLNYQVAYITDSIRLINNKVESINLDTLKGSKEGNYIDFYYAYYFNAYFKKGLNTIKHTYKYDLSGGICYNYSFEYVLTAANRWANQQIEEFTLIIDPGELESFEISNSFFHSEEEWNIVGIGKALSKTKSTSFYIRNGLLIFEKNNFVPTGELHVSSSYCEDGVHSETPPLSYNALL